MTKLKEPIPAKLLTGQQILQGMPELAYVFNKEGRMLMWNSNVELVLGYSKDELYNKPVSNFQDVSDKERVLGVFEKVISDGKERTVEYNMLTKSGEKIPYLGSGSKLLVDGKEYLIGLAIDISKLKKTEAKLKSKIEEIENLRSQLQAENIYLRKEIKNKRDFEHIIGESEPLTHALYRVEQVA